MAYMSNEQGETPEIYIRPYPVTDAKYQITTGGGGEPLWSPDGKQLFYYLNSKLHAVDIRTEPAVSFGKGYQWTAVTLSEPWRLPAW
jgi:WD40-like Beta Propeller Repeat